MTDNTAILEKNNQRPFPGLLSFDESNKTLFGGRDAEIKELFNLVENHRLTIVFGKSGIGKTSLINAGLIPKLQNNFYLPIYFRIDFSSEKRPLDQLTDIINRKVKHADKDAPEIGDRSLWEYFNEDPIMGGIVKPVIILDQFEELFTLGRDKIQESFITELADLAENRIPLVVQKQYENTTEMISSKFGDQHCRVVISLREDYLAQLESLKGYLPSLKDSRFRVGQLTPEQAMDAVLKPAGDLADEEVAALIIEKLPGLSEHAVNLPFSQDARRVKLSIEPFLLSLICYQVNERRIEKRMKKIVPDLVSAFDFSQVIKFFYNDTLKLFDPKVSQMIEDTLLTERGYRKLQSLEELERDYKVGESDIQKLIENRIIRKEQRDDVEYVELIHDVLIPVIKEKKALRLRQKNDEERDEAIKKGIASYRLQRNRNIRIAAYVLVPLLSVLAFFFIQQKRQLYADAIKHENAILAKRLLVTSSSFNIDTIPAAHLSMISYLLNQIADGDDDITFYNSMYARLKTLGEKFHVVSLADSSQVRTILNAGDNHFYFGTDRGELYVITPGDSVPLLVCRFKERITSMSVNPGKKYLAVAGNFNYIRIFDLLQQPAGYFDIPISDSLSSGILVRFRNDAGLVASINSSLVDCNIATHALTPHTSDRKLYLMNGKAVSREISAAPFIGNSMGKSLSMAVSGDNIAVGMDSGIILITKDTFSLFTSANLQFATSLAFDPHMQYLFIGIQDGSVHRLNLSNFDKQTSQYQVSRITDINFSSDAAYMVSASFDGSVAVWNVDANWNTFTPLRIFLPREELVFLGDVNAAYCVSFDKDNTYFLAGYANGRILKWPVSTQVLSSLICTRLPSSFNKEFLRQHNISRKETIDQLLKDTCQKKN